MTKEKAIKYVNAQLDKAVDDADFMEDEMYDALQILVKIAEQELCEDAVSREAVLKEIPRLWNSDGDKDYCMETLRDYVSELPPATPTRKKGKWVTKFHGFPPEPSTVCSNCDYDIDFEISKLVKADAFTIKPYRPKSCPNCGIEMESELIKGWKNDT